MITITNLEWGKIMAWREVEMPIGEIAKRLRCSRNTVEYWIGRDPPAVKRSRKLSARRATTITNRRKLVRKLALQKTTRIGQRYTPVRRKVSQREIQLFPTSNPPSIARRLTLQGVRCSKSTARRDLIAMNFVPRSRPRAPLLTEKHKVNRISFGEKFLSKADIITSFIRYGDEKIFTDNENLKRVVWVQKGTKPPPRKVEQGPFSVTAFFCIGVGFRFCKVMPRTTLNKDSFRSLVLSELAVALRKDGGILMLDNAPAHTGWDTHMIRRRVRVLSKVLGIKWPAQSPDGSPVEQLNALIEQRVQERGPYGEDELERFIKEEFARVPQLTLDKLCLSAPDRWKRIIEEEGATIRP